MLVVSRGLGTIWATGRDLAGFCSVVGANSFCINRVYLLYYRISTPSNSRLLPFLILLISDFLLPRPTLYLSVFAGWAALRVRDILVVL
jgi:hypothetical protein